MPLLVLDADKQPSIHAPPASQCRASAEKLPTADAEFSQRRSALPDTREVRDLCRSHHLLMIALFELLVKTPPRGHSSLTHRKTAEASVQLQ